MTSGHSREKEQLSEVWYLANGYLIIESYLLKKNIFNNSYETLSVKYYAEFSKIVKVGTNN